MSLDLAIGFVIGIGSAVTIIFASIYLESMRTNDDEDCILYLLENQLEDSKLIEELLEENKKYKIAMQKRRDEQDKDYWG